MNKYIIFASLGMELVGLMLASLYLGRELDVKFGTNGLLLALLSFGSLIGWLVHIIYLIKRLDKDSDQ